MVRTLVIPGYRGSERGHWQDHFLKNDPTAGQVRQDDWDHPVLSEWLYRLEAELLLAPRAVLVAHSLGALLVAHLHGRPATSHVAGALLVAPADGARMAREDDVFASFARMPEGRLPFPSILVASQNDPFMSFPTAQYFAERWGSAFIDLGEAGHINPASGYGEWPEAQILVDSLKEREKPRRWQGATGPHAAETGLFSLGASGFGNPNLAG